MQSGFLGNLPSRGNFVDGHEPVCAAEKKRALHVCDYDTSAAVVVKTDQVNVAIRAIRNRTRPVGHVSTASKMAPRQGPSGASDGAAAPKPLSVAERKRRAVDMAQSAKRARATTPVSQRMTQEREATAESREELKLHSAVFLRRMCQRHDIPDVGEKEDVVDRLASHFAGRLGDELAVFERTDGGDE